MSAIIFAVHCNYCGKQRAPSAVLDMPGGVRVCLHCLEWHNRALNFLATAEPPSGCQGCGKSHQQLDAELGERYIGMYVHGPVDGIYQVLCPVCSDAIRPKQRDRYRGTEFGARKGL